MSDYNSPLRTAKRRARDFKREVKSLSYAVNKAIKKLDALMKKPSTHARGCAVAQVLNELDMANQIAEHFVLKQPLTSRPRKS